MKKKIVIIALVLFILAVSAYVIGFRNFSRENNSVEIDGHQFQVELAVDSQTRQKGLGDRNRLCADCGMLFLFPQKEVYPFWMKNMRFNLDIIWISDGKIAYIAKNKSFHNLELIDPGLEADKVLEINAGLADKYNFAAGDGVKIKQD